MLRLIMIFKSHKILVYVSERMISNIWTERLYILNPWILIACLQQVGKLNHIQDINYSFYSLINNWQEMAPDRWLYFLDHRRRSHVMYFLECGRNTGFKFKSIQWCSIESAALRNPNKSVVVVFLFYNAVVKNGMF